MRWLVRLLLFLFVLVIIGVGALALIPGDRIARIAERQFEQATGRAMTLSGDVRATIYPQLGVQLSDIEIANAEWSNSGPMLKADSVTVGVAMMPLLSGQVRIKHVEIVEPEFLLEVSSDGRGNWDFETGQGPSAQLGAQDAAGSIPAFSLDQGIIRGGSVRYLNHATGYDVNLSDLDMDLSVPEFAGPGTLAMSAIVNNTLQSFDADVARFDNFIGGAVTQIDAQIGVGPTSIAFKGRGGYAPAAFEGDVNANLQDMAAVFETAGKPAPILPNGLGQNVTFDGHLTYTENKKAFLRDGTLTLDQNTLKGEADVDLSGAVPLINAQFTTATLDLSALAAGDGDSGSDAANGGAPSTGWSTDRIDASGLAAFNGKIAFRAEAVDLGTLKLGPTRVLTTNDRSRIVFELREVNAYDGQVSGRFVMNNRNGLSVGGSLAGRGLSVQPLMDDLADYERISGTLDAEIEFLGVGNSVDAIMKSLSGKGAVLLGAGEMRGLDLVGMLRNLDASYEGEGSKTVFESVGATFDIANGVLHNDDLNFQASRMTATGEGDIGIGTKTLDYRVIPVALTGGEGSEGLSVPVLITGTWADPKFRPDLEFLLNQELADERRAVEERLRVERDAAKERLRQEAEERLGVTVEEGESTEDALRRRLEEEAADALRNLLGGN